MNLASSIGPSRLVTIRKAHGLVADEILSVISSLQWTHG